MKLRMMLLLFLLFTSIAYADNYDVRLRPNHPYRYQIKPGDTLWSVASKFLQNPYEWRRLWARNPGLNSPNMLYPGDILELHLVNGYPRLQVMNGGTIRLSPHIRIDDHRKPIPTVPLKLIKSFLNNSLVIPRTALMRAPYVVDVRDHLVGGGASDIYVRSIPYTTQKVFNVYRKGDAYIDPDTKNFLGQQATFVGKAKLLQAGAPATLTMITIAQEVAEGDRILPATSPQFTSNFMPQAPDFPVHSQIIDMLDGAISQIGMYDSVVIVGGRCEGLRVGDVLGVYHRGETILDPVMVSKDPYVVDKKKVQIKLPNRYAGQLLLYRIFDHVSYGLVVDAIAPLRIYDVVSNPEHTI